MMAGDFIRKRALIDRKPADGDYFARNTKGYFGNRGGKDCKSESGNR